MAAIQRGFNLSNPTLWKSHREPINFGWCPLTISPMRKRLYDTLWGITTLIRLIIGQTIMGTLTLPPNSNGRVLSWKVTRMCMADLTYHYMFQNRIVTMATSSPNDLVTTVCDNMISLTAIQRDEIMNNGWAWLADFQGFNCDRKHTWEMESNRLPASRDGCYFGSLAMEKLQGITYWVNQMLLHRNTFFWMALML